MLKYLLFWTMVLFMEMWEYKTNKFSGFRKQVIRSGALWILKHDNEK